MTETPKCPYCGAELEVIHAFLPKCHDKLVEKPGYGRVCQKCGLVKEERGKEQQ